MGLLQSERLLLRALEPEDLEQLYRWENNPEWWDFGNTLSPYSRYLLKAYIADSHRDIYESKQLRLMVILRSTGVAIGMVDLYDFDPHHKRAAVGILIDPLYRNSGIAVEALGILQNYAFSFLKLHQLYAYVSVNNEASKNLFSHCGYAITGKLADWIIEKNGYSDVLIMQLMSSE